MMKMKNLESEQINDDEYSTCLVNMSNEVNFITLLLNKNLFKYNIHHNSKCILCKNEEVCSDYVSRLKKKILNMNREDVYSIKIVKSNRVTETYKDILKLNCDYVTLTRKRNVNRNTQLRRRIEQMNLNKEEIKVLKM